jgi:two-component system nitrate/nitrite response regulator NarL
MNRKPLRVVVADDHPLYRQGVVRALEAGGELVVGEASDGATALKLIRRNPPDVALVDVRMPRMDGIDVVEDLTRHGPAVPVVLLSAFDDSALMLRGLAAGAWAFITKDADRGEILNAVRTAALDPNRPARPVVREDHSIG